MLLNRLRRGDPSTLLNTALLIPLRRKEPRWLLRNCRPVLLEPYLRRLEALIVFRRWRHMMELGHKWPSLMVAYRSQLGGSHAALALRLLIAHFAERSEVIVLDWDESSAFCNIPRQDLASCLPSDDPGLAKWAVRHYAALGFRVSQMHGHHGI